MSEQIPQKKSFYFSTRDLLIMAVLAALGGVASTYINTLGDAVQAFLGMAGGSQWAAGLHVIWIILAMAITGKPGTGILTGLVKGSVELLSGNSHGLIILLVDLIAGLLVDFGFLLFRKKRSLLPYLIAGGLASGSNVIVFQLFATLPTNILAASAVLILTLVAVLSGVIFAGFIPKLIVDSLIKGNIVKVSEQPSKTRKTAWYVLLSVFILSILFTFFLMTALKGAPTIQINGAVETEYGFPGDEFEHEMVTRQMEYKGVMTEYTGYLLSDAIQNAGPSEDADTLLIEASDGYAFLLSFTELENNPNILAVPKGSGKNTSYDIVGPESSKAWIRGVTKFTVIVSESVTILDPSGQVHEFDPDNWVSDMDSTQVALPNGAQKLQGVPVWKIVEANLSEGTPTEVVFKSDEDSLVLGWDEVSNDDTLRLFTVIEEDGLSFTLAYMSGEVQLYPVTEIEIN